ncbi:MAG TPA: hypothetical protein VMI31_16160 [Fimbriimonadaceae bacterium]|nr:hypothetical protein [Fimbriimonadaceae bacterium]
MKRLILFGALILPVLLYAQAQKTPAASPDPQAGPWQPFLANLHARSVGPTNMGGRCVDLAVYDKEPRIYYVASASGGLWKTTNAGVTFAPVFDRENSVSIGACAVSQKNPDIVWVGTGEATSRNSVAWGDGVYKSSDGGKTWANMGLKETMHISRVLIDPNDDNTVYVGALGRTWGYNKERGVYKTTDGGKTWKQVLYVDDKTGVADMVIDRKNPNDLVVAMWQHIRMPYDFDSGGPGSGLYRTTDAGKTWHKVTKGLPGAWPKLDTLTDTQIIRLANYFDIPHDANAKAADLLPKVKAAVGSSTLPLGRIGLADYYKDPKTILATVEYIPLGKQTNGLRVEMNGGGTFMSHDGGESWEQTSTANPRPFYFSRPEIDPNDANRQYLGGDSLLICEDGKTFRNARAHVHPDIHAMWIQPDDSYHMLLLCDGGLYETRDRGATWLHYENMAIGQFYAATFDDRKPYWVYGGLQDNGSWGQPTQNQRGSTSWFDAVGVGGGDGFHVASDPEDWRWLYSESQGGAIGRHDLKTGLQRYVRPRGEGLRFNWSTPFIISPHNSSTLYIGGNKLFKTVDRGDHWEAISPDLSTNDPAKEHPGRSSITPEDTGAETYCTIITISESPRKQGLIYVGTDDGLVQMTQDDGAHWTNLTPNIPDLPAGTWCSRVLASKWDDGRVYATFDGHRDNDFKPYVYVSGDYGKTWSKLSAGLPDYDCVYVVCEGEQNPNLLFLGSEMSLRVSLDLGKTWSRFRSGDFPTVAVHDLVVNPREEDLVIATHGRSIYTLDIAGLEAMTDENRGEPAFMSKPQNIYLLGMRNDDAWDGDGVFSIPNTQPGTEIQYYLQKDQPGDVTVHIGNADDSRSEDLTGSGKAGLNTVRWTGRLLGRLASPGDYRVTITVGGKPYTNFVHVEDVSGN